MKQILILVSIVLIGTASFAQSDTLSFETANSMYEKGQYEKVIPAYEYLLKTNGPSAIIYYNLGNAYYKMNETGNAVLNYERCLKLKPNDEDAQYNLDIANLKIKDQIQPVNELFLTTWWRQFIIFFPEGLWSLISIALIWMALLGFFIFRFAGTIARQKIGFYLFIIMLILFSIAITAKFSRQSYDKNYHFAIIMQPSVIIKNEPNESSSNLTLLHEGFKLRILDYEGDWTKVKMPDGNIGWLLSAGIEEI